MELIVELSESETERGFLGRVFRLSLCHKFGRFEPHVLLIRVA